MQFLAAFLTYCFSNTAAPTRVIVASAMGGCSALIAWYLIKRWLCKPGRPEKLEEMRERLKTRARSVFLFLPGIHPEDEDGDTDGDENSHMNGETENEEEERRETDQTVVGTAPRTARDRRKQSRSPSWLPRIFVRGVTGDDMNSPGVVEMAEV